MAMRRLLTNRRFLLAGTVFTGCLLNAPTSFASLPDAAYVPTTTDNTIVAARFESAQTFTVQQTGTLTSVDVQVGRFSGISDPTSLTLDVRTTIGGIPTEADSGPTVLSSLTLPASQIPLTNGRDATFISFDLPDFSVHAGDLLAIALTTDAGPVFGASGDVPFAWMDDNPGAYAGGRAFARGVSAAALTWGDGDTFSLATTDHGFRAFVTPVPEPATAIFTSIAGAASLISRRRRISIT